VIHDGMLYDSIQVNLMSRSQLVQKLRKWPILKSVSSAGTHLIKRLMVNHDTPRQYLNFNWTAFWYSFSFGVTWPSNFGYFAFGKRILPLTRSTPTVTYGAHLWQVLTPNYV